MAFGSIYFLTSIIIIDRYCLRPDRPLSISRSCDGNLLSRSRSVGEEVERLEKVQSPDERLIRTLSVILRFTLTTGDERFDDFEQKI